MQETIHEVAREIPVYGTYDVVIAGGGIGGVAAALAAARAGARVCLLEKACELGGLATIGNVVYYLPLCDGAGHQICGGISEELLRLSVKEETEAIPEIYLRPVPECWRRKSTLEARSAERYMTGFHPALFSYRMERLLLKHKVKLLFDTRITAVCKSERRITAVIVENKGGRSAVCCQAVVDATGDADVCALAGEKTVSLKTNVRCGWYYYVRDGKVTLSALSKHFSMDGGRAEGSGRAFRGDDADQVTEMLLASRQFMMEDLKEKTEGTAGGAYPLRLPQIPCFRMTRRLAGKRTLRESDAQRWFENSLGMTGDWRKAGPVYCLPLEILAAVKTDNLITAGRCISSAGRAWDVTRAIPTCAVTGQAAGTAAAFLALDQQPRFADLHIPALQKYLKQQKVIIEKALLI